MPRKKSLNGEPIMCAVLSSLMSYVKDPDPGVVGGSSSGNDEEGTFKHVLLYIPPDLHEEYERLYMNGRGKGQLRLLIETCELLERHQVETGAGREKRGGEEQTRC